MLHGSGTLVHRRRSDNTPLDVILVGDDVTGTWRRCAATATTVALPADRAGIDGQARRRRSAERPPDPPLG